MNKARQPFLFLAVICWAILIGGVVFAHIATLPSLLSHLPESSVLANGTYAIHDATFCAMIHPVTILAVLLALVFNWNDINRRKLIGTALGIYVIALIATYFYFIPELMAFLGSSNSTSVSAAEWYNRGQQWLHLSWIRGLCMALGFVLLLVALSRPSQQAVSS